MYRFRYPRRWLALLAWLLAWPLRAAYLLFLRAVIWDTERYLCECAADGLAESLSIRHFAAQLERDQERVSRLRQVLRSRPC